MIKKEANIKQSNCLNCGYPFNGQEKFCAECGQKNKGQKLKFSDFINEIFKGFTSWDAKFWRTIFPLLFKPGKVSRDYIEGKRIRYVNPFRFYLTSSIIFFLVMGLTNSYNKFNSFQSNKSTKDFNTLGLNLNGDTSIDSIQDVIFKQIDKTERKKDSIKQLIDSKSYKNAKDSLELIKALEKYKVTIGFKEDNSVLSFMKFQKAHPNLTTNQALDSLSMNKTFSNRFWYSRAELINSFFSKKGETEKFNQKLISYSSVSLFILLPLFSLFLWLIYYRHQYTYIEHLIFVFHTQTVFFLFSTIFYLLDFFTKSEYIIQTFFIFFLMYLFIAMKKFYDQKYPKTILKFILANIFFMFLSFFGILFVSAIAFTFY